MSETVWTVDAYTDNCKQRKCSAVEKDKLLYPSTKWNIFETECAAREWMVRRAKERVFTAEVALGNEQRRLDNCERKLRKVAK